MLDNIITGLVDLLFSSETTTKNLVYFGTVAAFMAKFFILIDIGWTAINTALANMDNAHAKTFIVSPQKILRYIVLLAAINTYSQVGAPLLMSTIKGLNNATSPSHEQLTKIVENWEEINKKADADLKGEQQLEEGENGQTPAVDSAEAKALEEARKEEELSIWRKIALYVSPNYWITKVFQFLGSIVGLVTSVVAAVVLNVLITFFPLSIALSILPIFKDVGVKCLNAILTTGFVFSTINVLQAIQGAFAENFNAALISHTTLGLSGLGLTLTLVVNLVFLILYAMAFWLTSKWAGSVDTGRVLSKIVAVGTAAATGGSSTVVKGAAAAATK